MNTNYERISLGKSENYLHPDAMNFLIFSKDTKVSSHKSFSEPFVLEGYFFGLCISGNSRIRINYKEYRIQPNSILIMSPDQIISIEEKSDDFMLESIYISPDFIASLPIAKDFSFFFKIRKNPYLQVSKLVMQNLQEYYSFIEKRSNRTNMVYLDNIIKGLLFSMITEILSVYKSDEKNEEHHISSRQEEIVDRFFKLLLKYYDRDRSVAFYADKLCITPKYLSFTVKQATGRSVLYWIHEVFIINSKVLLKSTNKSVAEISDELNVSNDSFFCRFFKKHTGMSPLEYRNFA
ncbi:MAG: AraC family transcriptional regulator [Bacteroidales bacterium]|jgi:AraC-like DNA-binding protein|nr:AraC family transcriptional regulator [Bacteroidales bacterium]